MARWLDVPIADFILGNDSQSPAAANSQGVFSEINRDYLPKPSTQKFVDGDSGLVNTVRDTAGMLSYFSPDGTNCTRTMGVALKGTPYEGMVNVDQFDEMSELLHMKRDVETYKPKAGDIAVVNGGNHMIMITENGGFINNGFSRGGIWESEQSYDDYAGKGKIDYYITTSDYEKLYEGNTPKGAKKLGISRDKDAIRSQLQAAIERSYNYNAPATGKTYKWGGKQ